MVTCEFEFENKLTAQNISISTPLRKTIESWKKNHQPRQINQHTTMGNQRMNVKISLISKSN
jgi:hypothetical protein